MSGDFIHQLVGDQKIISQILDILTCLNCHKQSFINKHYQQQCHVGIYCPQCIKFCSKCCTVQASPPPSLGSFLQKVSISCQYTPYGCQAIVPFNTAQSHELNCLFSHSKPKNTNKKESTDELFPNMGFISQDPKQCESEFDGSVLLASNNVIQE